MKKFLVSIGLLASLIGTPLLMTSPFKESCDPAAGSGKGVSGV